MISARVLSIVACTGLAVARALPAEAQPARPAAQNNAQTELTELFAAFCLMKFPDEGAADNYAHAKGFKPMPDGQVRSLLGSDGGNGWLYETAYGNYTATIEQSPTHACAIRVRFEKIGDIKDAFGTLIKLWAATQHTGNIKELPSGETQVGGRATDSHRWELAGSKGQETFTALVTPNAGEGETELRLVRTIPDQ